MSLPDIIAICASSPEQARAFSAALDRRLSAGIYPREIEFVVVHDPPAGRVGSGGGTLNALAQLPTDRSILLIHAGGESRRLPAWAPEGKLFAPVPVASSTVESPVLLDVQLALYLRYPWRPGELVVASGDVFLDFDTNAVRDERGEVCGFAVPADFAEGSRHGVFIFDRLQRGVTGYRQKAPEAELRRSASLPGGTQCAIDTGIVAFNRDGRVRLERLWDYFGSAISDGSVYIDLYLEILSASLDRITKKEFESLVKPQSRLNQTDRTFIRKTMAGSSLQGVLGRRSVFLHYGSISQVPATAASISSNPEIRTFYDVPAHAGLNYEICPQLDRAILVNDCRETYVGLGPVRTTEASFVDACLDVKVDLVGGSLVTGVDRLYLPAALPDGFCLDGRGSHVVVYHRSDSLKASDEPLRFCAALWTQWLADRGLDLYDLGIAMKRKLESVWDLPVWPALPDKASPRERGRFVAAFWDATLADQRWRAWLTNKSRQSLHDLTASVDLTKREARRTAIRAGMLRESVLAGRGWQVIPANEANRMFSSEDLPALVELADSETDELIKAYRQRFLREIDDVPSPVQNDSIQIPYLSALTTPPPLKRSVKPDQIVWARCPVRMDLGGGWTDTPPYTLREGGRVCNVAIDLNGQPPVQVFCRPLASAEIRFHSIDLGEGERITSFAELEDYQNPLVPFALPRAAMCILGFTQARHVGRTLAEVLTDLGGGMEVTLLAAVPKGSGLGTSSILGAVILAAMERFFGVFDEAHINTGELYRQVLQMEQMLTTGGGWQDQIGGVAGGVKYAISPPGLRPELSVYQLDPWLFQAPVAVNRYTLFYTGVTRLARNILEEVVDGYNSMDPATIFTVRRIAALADMARDAFALRDIDRLGTVVRESWKQNCLIHPSTTNDEIDDMLSAPGIPENYQAMKLLGAGGGGYAFFISETPHGRSRLRDGLESWAKTRSHSGARVVDLSLNSVGLHVTVS